MANWCKSDEHHLYELYEDFNEWLDGEDGTEVRESNAIDGLSQPSKAFYASDKEAYEQALEHYKSNRYQEVLSKGYLSTHWYEKNVSRFDQLVEEIANGNVNPFVGAGLSVAGGFPTWDNHLRQQAKTAGMPKDHIEELLSEGAFEQVLEEIEQKRGRDVFVQEIVDVFGKTGSLTNTTFLLSELFTDTLLTTNYDKLIEQAFDTGANKIQVITRKNAKEAPKADHITVIKLHGNVANQNSCILSKNQYDEAYGCETIDMSLPIPKLLEYYYKNSSLLFLGSSLHSDRTVDVFRTIKESLGDVEIPRHFSIEATPETEEKLVERNAYLANLGIVAIWFEQGRYEYIEMILQLARNEVRYRGISEPKIEIEEHSLPEEVELSTFLRDLTDLMPLMHWLHRHVPQKETAKYLRNMQRVFISGSFFMDGVDANLRIGIDNLARAILNKPKFDGYTHGKLLVAFNSFQEYFKSMEQDNHVNRTTKWDVHELLNIPIQQFRDHELKESNLNYHVARLAIALLTHGLNQKNSPKKYCELPENLNAEMSDYLTLILKNKLEFKIPDRMEEGQTEEIRALCKNAWEYGVDDENFLKRVFGK